MEKATMELFTKLNIDLSTNTLDNMTIERDLLLIETYLHHRTFKTAQYTTTTTFILFII